MKTSPLPSRRRFIGQASCAAVGSVSVLNSLLNLTLTGRLAAASTDSGAEYRALVCLFLTGGNDSFNMLVPQDPAAYAEYRTARSNLALPPEKLTLIQPVGRPPFALHHRMPGLAALYERGEAAFVTNVGTLVEPVRDAAEVAENRRRLPLGLYSHSDQVEQWQTGVPQTRSGYGWAGRAADLLKQLNANQRVAMNISLDGANVWQTGTTVAEYAITRDGAVPLIPYQPHYAPDGPGSVLDHIISSAVDRQATHPYSNLLQQAFLTKKRDAVDAYADFSRATAPPLPAGVVFPETALGAQLAMVARTIAGRAALGVCRQTFFVNRGGWDHHNEVLDNQEVMLAEVSDAVTAFQNALVALGVSKNVTLFGASDFGRTLTSNGRGSDHAWGGNQFVVGGAVRGRRLYGRFPSLRVNPEDGPTVNPLDTGRGVLIPTTSCDEYFGELALWLGVTRSNLPLVLPNIGNFVDLAGTAPPVGFLV